MTPISILLVNCPDLSLECVDDMPLRVDRVAGVGETAVAASKREYRIVIARLPLQDRSPKDLIYFLRSAPGAQCRSSSVIALVPPRNPAAVHAALGAGMKDDYLTDPAQPGELRRLVAKYANPPTRRDVRLMLRAKVDLPLQDRPFFGQSLNLSRSGVLMALDRELPMGAPIEMQFTLPGDPRPLKAHSVVTREARERKVKGRAYGMQFTHVEPRDHSRLAEFLGE